MDQPVFYRQVDPEVRLPARAAGLMPGTPAYDLRFCCAPTHPDSGPNTNQYPLTPPIG